MNLGEAIECLKAGHAQTDNPVAPKCRIPWLASQTDMLAEDWYIVA